ncbi:MAG: anaerobic ribonucleoside-triphosphate reductase activating protein [Muribaculaceae bacterium]|nr:anaerobic ribonucleoside-triphosphate reductase activating protein [Muribaculaceae bacterium]
MRVIDIVPGTTVDGPGLRTSIYFAGCSHACPGCHNPQTHDPRGGHEMTDDEILAVVEENGFDVTFTGGDPLMQVEELCRIAGKLRERGYGLWCYTGYLYEHVYADEKLSAILQYLDVLVDGPFIESERDVSLRFRGSRNQRLICVPQSTPGSIVVFDEE